MTLENAIVLGLVAVPGGARVPSPSDAFDGFGSEIIIILASIMPLGRAIVKRGVSRRQHGRV